MKQKSAKRQFILIPAHDYDKKRLLELEGYFPAEYSVEWVKMRLDFPNGLNPNALLTVK